MTIKEKAAEILAAIKYRLTAPIVERNLESAMEWARMETIEQFKEYLDKKRCEWKDGEDSYHHSIKARILSEIINELFKEEQK